MAVQTQRLSSWFRSHLHQKHHQLVYTRKSSFFNLFGGLFGREPLQVYNRSGRAVILNTTSLEQDEEDGATINVDISIENDYSPKYNPSKDVIIRNYSSCLTFAETEAIIRTQKTNSNSKIQPPSNNTGVIGQTFAGIIESIPDKLKNDKNFSFEIGDRVWGVSPSSFGHCWSDYVPIPSNSINHAPINIPLHYCGLYPLHIYSLCNLLRYSQHHKLSDLKNKTVLFIGTGRRSMINIFAPFLKKIDENNKIIVIDNEQTTRFNEKVLKQYLNIDEYHRLKYDEEGNIEGFNELMDDIYNQQCDIVVDSWANDQIEIIQNCKFLKAKGSYFWRQNHMTQFMNGNKFGALLQGTKFLANIDKELKKLNGIKFAPNMDSQFKKNDILDEFSSYLTEMSFPIIIDKLYNLDDVENAFNYFFNNDDSTLGENIGIVIKKEKDSDSIFFEENCRPKTIKLPSITNINSDDKKQTKLYDREDYIKPIECVDDIIEMEVINYERDGYTQESKINVVESQTIAKNTSNKT